MTQRDIECGANQRRLFDCFRPAFFLGFVETGAGLAELLLGAATIPIDLVVAGSRTSGGEPGYQIVYMVRHRSSLSGVRTCTSFCHNFMTTASTSLPSTLVMTLSPTLNGFFTNPE